MTSSSVVIVTPQYYFASVVVGVTVGVVCMRVHKCGGGSYSGCGLHECSYRFHNQYLLQLLQRWFAIQFTIIHFFVSRIPVFPLLNGVVSLE